MDLWNGPRITATACIEVLRLQTLRVNLLTLPGLTYVLCIAFSPFCLYKRVSEARTTINILTVILHVSRGYYILVIKIWTPYEHDCVSLLSTPVSYAGK